MQDYHLEEMDGEYLLYHPVKTQAMHLNETASLVWRLCDGQRDVQAIRQLLVGVFPEQGQQVANDVMDALEQLAGRGVIRIQTITMSMP